MRKLIFCFLLAIFMILFSAILVWAENGIIQGTVIDSQTGEKLSKVDIILKLDSSDPTQTDQQKKAISDLDGLYSIDDIIAGKYIIAARKVGYSETVVSDIEVTPDLIMQLDIALTPEAIQLGTINVTASISKATVAGLIATQRKAPTIGSSISIEQIKRTPDSNASDALKRVTGLSVVNDRYVFVRGLSERYSNARLNNAAISSPEPDKWVVPFDIFPASLLDNIVVTKTFVPDLPGDFTGGSIQMTTKDFTDGFSAKLSSSFTYEPDITFKDFYTYEGGKTDFLGFDDGTRALPEDIKKASKNKKIVEGGIFGGGFTAQELENFGESFSNIWSPETKTAFLNQSYGLSLGNQINVLNRPFGIVTALTYKNGYSVDNEEEFHFINGADGKLEARRHIQDYTTSKFKVAVGGVLNFAWKLSPTNKMALRTTYNRISDDEVRQYSILPNRDYNRDEKSITLRWVERTILSTQLSGERQISFRNSDLDWQASYSLATRNEPDKRELLYESKIDKNQYRLANESQSGSRFFSDLTDKNLNLGLNLSIPFIQWNELPSKLKLGGDFMMRNREIDSRRFRFKPADNLTVDVYQDAEKIFVPENIGSKGFQLEEDTRSTDNYKAEQIVDGGYAMVDMPLIKKLRLVTGARLEFSDQKVTTFELFNPNDEPVVGQVKTTDILPSVNLTYSLTDSMNIRVAGSQTVSRPSFRELSKFEFTDISGHATVGNPKLQRALIQNYDARWEWYTGITEYMSIAGFYKKFKNPIEKTIMITSAEQTSSWQNAKSAYNYRIEMEMRESLKYIKPSLARLVFTGNLALIKSEVQLYPGGYETSKKRALQGQSPYVINAMATYIFPKTETDLSILYNVSGRRISEVGVAGTPDIYEEPFHRTDIVISQSLGDRFSIKLSGKNLLDPEAKYTQGEYTQRIYTEGRSFSIELSYSW
jgi:outer membrane receptor protein involved in Fe transport